MAAKRRKRHKKGSDPMTESLTRQVSVCVMAVFSRVSFFAPFVLSCGHFGF
jgi:hypothetical protein